MVSDTAEFGLVLTRLEALERQNRRVKRTGVVVLLFLAALFLMGQASPKKRTIEAERLVITHKGKVRGEFNANFLVFYAPDGKEQMALDADHLAFFDPSQPQGTQARIFLQVLKGEPTLWASNKQGKIIWSVP